VLEGASETIFCGALSILTCRLASSVMVIGKVTAAVGEGEATGLVPGATVAGAMAVGVGTGLVGTEGEGSATEVAAVAAVCAAGAIAVDITVGATAEAMVAGTVETDTGDGADVGDGVQPTTRSAASTARVDARKRLFNDFSLRVVDDCGPRSWTHG
jgi:hypothetical protein